MDSNQAVVVNGIPLLGVAIVYALASMLLAPLLWRERRQLAEREAELLLALVFLCGAVAAAILGVLVIARERPLGGNVWVALAAILVALVPGAVALLRWSGGLPPGMRPPGGGEGDDVELREEVDAFTAALARTTGVEEVGRLLVAAVCSLLRIEYASLMLVEGREGLGLVAHLDGADHAPFASQRIELGAQPSAAATVAFEASPVVVHELGSSPLVERALVEEAGLHSAAFVPLVSRDGVVAVLGAATTSERRAFSPDELRLLQELAAESALAVDRTRSTLALSTALERERLVADISRRLRTKLDPAGAMQLAVEEAAPALRASRCYVRLGDADASSLGAEWWAAGSQPIGDRPAQFLVARLAARERRTVAVADILTAPQLDDATQGSREVLAGLGTKAALATPIVVFDRLIGVLGFHRPQPGRWSDADVALAEAVARELGLVLHTASVIAENERRLRQESALLESARSLTGELDPDAVLRRLVHEVAKLLHSDAADCYLLDPEREVLRCVAVHGLADDLVGYEFPADRGLSGEALARGRAIVAVEYEQVTDPVPHPAYASFAHAIVAPVLWSGEPRGVLGVGSHAGGRRFDDADAEVLEAFAGMAALALRNAEAFEERSRQARVQRGFYRIASMLGQTLSLQGTLEAVAQAAAEALGGTFASVLVPRGSRLELAAAHELPAELAEAFAEGLPVEEVALHAAAAERRLLAAPDVLADDRFARAWRDLCRRAGCRSLLAIPVQARDEEPAGLVIVFFPDERRLSEDDLELAEQLASAARGALERSGRFEDERRRRALAQQLARTGSLLASALDPVAVLDDVVERAPALLGVDACAIRTIEDDEVVVRAAAGEGTEAMIDERAPATGWLAGDVIQSGEPLALEDAAADERLRRFDSLLRLGYHAFLGVPLAGSESGVHGVLSVYDRRRRVWREEEVEALRALAGNASAALRNAQLYQDVALAREQADAILSNIADGIVAVDREGEVVLWNSAAERITGVPAAEAVGRTPGQVLGRSLEGRPDVPVGDRLVPIRRGGDEVWLSVTEAIMRDPAGAVAARIYAFRDISSDRFVEQLKSEFVSRVSQELRRPLTSIYGFAETLLRRDVAFGDEERRVFLGYIASESAHLTTIVDALLNVARLDSGDLQVTLVPTDVSSVVSAVVAQSESVTSDGHRFVVDLPEQPLSVAADPERLRQVLASLVDNAVKFSPGGGTVTLAARSRRGSVEVSVVDEGVGIAPGEQERIFRKFYRGDAVAVRGGADRGTGVGLFIAKGLVEKMGGRIRVTSAEGEGSRFSVELPLATGTGAARVNESERQRV